MAAIYPLRILGFYLFLYDLCICVVPWPCVSTLAAGPGRGRTTERRNPRPSIVLRFALEPTTGDKRVNRWTEQKTEDALSNKAKVRSVKAWVYFRKKRNLKPLKSSSGQLAFMIIIPCHCNNIPKKLFKAD